MLCDFENDDDKGRSIAEKATRPNKHPAVEGANDVAFLCSECQSVCCKNCYEEYPSEENTPVSDRGFLEDNNSLSDNKGPSENKGSNSPEDTHNKESCKSSLLDDFADPSSEMPDYMGCDD